MNLMFARFAQCPMLSGLIVALFLVAVAVWLVLAFVEAVFWCSSRGASDVVRFLIVWSVAATLSIALGYVGIGGMSASVLAGLLSIAVFRRRHVSI